MCSNLFLFLFSILHFFNSVKMLTCKKKQTENETENYVNNNYY